MKLFKILTIRKFFTNICVLIALIAMGSNAFQLRDSGKAIQSGVSGPLTNNINFLESKASLEKKKKKAKKAKTNLKLAATEKLTVGEETAKVSSLEKVENKVEKKAGSETEDKAQNTWGSKVHNIPYLMNKYVPPKNDTLSKAIFRGQDFRKWDFKMLDKQIMEIAELMDFKGRLGESQDGLRSFINLFISYFEKCDVDMDNQLSLQGK